MDDDFEGVGRDQEEKKSIPCKSGPGPLPEVTDADNCRGVLPSEKIRGERASPPNMEPEPFLSSEHTPAAAACADFRIKSPEGKSCVPSRHGDGSCREEPVAGTGVVTERALNVGTNRISTSDSRSSNNGGNAAAAAAAVAGLQRKVAVRNASTPAAAVTAAVGTALAESDRGNSGGSQAHDCRSGMGGRARDSKFVRRGSRLRLTASAEGTAAAAPISEAEGEGGQQEAGAGASEAGPGPGPGREGPAAKTVIRESSVCASSDQKDEGVAERGRRIIETEGAVKTMRRKLSAMGFLEDESDAGVGCGDEDVAGAGAKLSEGKAARRASLANFPSDVKGYDAKRQVGNTAAPAATTLACGFTLLRGDGAKRQVGDTAAPVTTAVACGVTARNISGRETVSATAAAEEEGKGDEHVVAIGATDNDASRRVVTGTSTPSPAFPSLTTGTEEELPPSAGPEVAEDRAVNTAAESSSDGSSVDVRVITENDDELRSHSARASGALSSSAPRTPGDSRRPSETTGSAPLSSGHHRNRRRRRQCSSRPSTIEKESEEAVHGTGRNRGISPPSSAGNRSLINLPRPDAEYKAALLRLTEAASHAAELYRELTEASAASAAPRETGTGSAARPGADGDEGLAAGIESFPSTPSPGVGDGSPGSDRVDHEHTGEGKPGIVSFRSIARAGIVSFHAQRTGANYLRGRSEASLLLLNPTPLVHILRSNHFSFPDCFYHEKRTRRQGRER